MKKNILRVFALMLMVIVLASCQDKTPEQTIDPSTESGSVDTTEPVKERNDIMINGISGLNTKSVPGSHNDKASRSSLELDLRSVLTLDSPFNNKEDLRYPRIKQLADGSFIMFYQHGTGGPNIYYQTSPDLVEWSKAKILFLSHESKWGTMSLYMTADAVVLNNGELLVVASFRDETYWRNPERNGLVVKRSTDNGATWSAEQQIYVGPNWEPGITQLASGEIQIYFTHIAPYISLYGFNDTIRSSGAGLIRSYDNGYTFTPNVTEPPYAAQRAMQCYVGTLDGRKIFNDQMPVPMELPDGTIVLACETRTFDNNFNKYGISIGWSYDNFAEDLRIDQEGPKDHATCLFTGYGPYLARFESGETVLSYTKQTRKLSLVVGNSKAKNFINETEPFKNDQKDGAWASLLTLDSHRLVFATDYKSVKGAANQKSVILTGTCYLNHDLVSKKMTPEIDGNADEWTENTDALFLGSMSQAQCTFRFACDADNVYILCERLDEYIDKNEDEQALYFSTGNGSFYKLTVDCNGVSQFLRNEKGKYVKIDSKDVRCAIGFNGEVGKKGGDNNGYVAEIAIPAELIDFKGELSFAGLLNNRDKEIGTRVESNGFSSVDLSNVSTWFQISFE